jgi:hypothetical protein
LFVYNRHHSEASVFQLAAATVPGRHHGLALRNNQDSFAWGERGGVLAAVVADGCGSAPRSEVGACLGAQLAVSTLLDAGLAGGAVDLAQVRAALLLRLAPLARELGTAAASHLLFTLVAVVVTPAEAVLFSCGDGLAAIDGDAFAIGPYEAPPYLGYALLPDAPGEVREGASELRLHRRFPASGLVSLALGTDGALGLLERRDGPGSLLDGLFADERCFTNPDGLRRRLVLHRREGMFADDATLVLLRRAP